MVCEMAEEKNSKYKQVTHHLWKMAKEVSLTKIQGLIFMNCREYLIIGEMSVESATSKDILGVVEKIMQKEKNSMYELRTAQLWLQYMDMIHILRNFIRSELTGNWKVHLQRLRDMLPYLAAAGHNCYTKSVHLYPQRLDQLPSQHPEVQKHFDNGLHVVRRSQWYWAGRSSDLVIEQVLMTSLIF